MQKGKSSRKSSSQAQNADDIGQNRLWNTAFPETVRLGKSQTLVTVQRNCFSKAWMAMLQTENLSEPLLKLILPKLQDDVVPFLKNPLLLSDCLTTFVATGGNFAILALGGLFVLMTQYGLEYPDFYTKYDDPSKGCCQYMRAFKFLCCLHSVCSLLCVDNKH